jgi:hypothetical protein
MFIMEKKGIEYKGGKIPVLKKKINAFLAGEEGKISKKSLLKIGGVLTMLSSVPAIMKVSAADQINEISNLTYQGDIATATHSNSLPAHISHSSY